MYSLKKQQGVATLVTAVVLMLAVFGISFFVSETVINEKQVASSDYRAKQAFMVAQAGIEYGRIVAESGSCAEGSPCSPAVDGGQVSVEIVSNGSDLYTIVSTGVSEDQSVSRTLSMAIGRLPSDSYPPNVPIVSRGGLGLSGNVKAVNNEEALTVWTSGDFGLGGSANTYISIDGNYNQLSSIKNPGGNNIYGPDVITNDPNLDKAPEVILDAFFGKDRYEDFAPDQTLDYSAGSDEYTVTCNSIFNGLTYSETVSSANLSTVIDNSDFQDCIDNFAQMSDYDVSDYTGQETKYYSSGDVTLGNSDFNNGTVPETSISDWEQNTNYDPDRNDLIESGSVAGANLTFSNTAVIGTPSDPVTIVVNGKLTLNSSPTIFGIIIADEIEFKGSPIIVGGVVVLNEGSVSEPVTGNGTPTIIMDKVVMQNTQKNPNFGPVKNSWKDW